MKASAPKTANARKIPERIGKYLIINEVGRGSTGTVYLSHDPYYGRDVAIKVYNIEAGGDDERARIARKMFLSEAHMVGMLHHPEHPADLRCRRGKRPLLHRHRARARRAHAVGLLPPGQSAAAR